MALKPPPPYMVFVPKPPHMPYSDAMDRLRTWLNCKKIELAGFKITAGARIGFELVFSGERDAAEFQLFDWPRAHS